MNLLLGLQLAKMSSPSKSQRTCFSQRLTRELSRKRRCHYSRLPGWFTLWPFLKISFRVFESVPKEVTFVFWFRKHLLTSLVVQWLRLLASNGGGTGSIPG